MKQNFHRVHHFQLFRKDNAFSKPLLIQLGLSLKAKAEICGKASKDWIVKHKVISDAIFGVVAACLLLLFANVSIEITALKHCGFIYKRLV